MSRSMFALVLTAFSIGCADDATSALDTLLMASIGGEEDALSRSMEAPADYLPLGRECDASGAFDELFAMYDANASGSLGAIESSDARADWPTDPHQMMMLDVLHLVYDLDASGELGDAERATLLDDFTVRCDTMAGKLIAEFDADTDGALSDAELETAREVLDARHAEERAEMEARCEGGPPAEGSAAEGSDHGGLPPEGELPPSPLAMEFDADADGALSATEQATLVSTVRARIRNGEMPVAPPEDAASAQ